MRNAVRTARKLIMPAAFLVALAACGAPPPDTCNPMACPGQSVKSYQVCTNISTTVETVKYGTMSCDCDTVSPESTQCMTCGDAITTWCNM